MTTEQLVKDFFHAGKNHTSLGCCGGDNCYEKHDIEIKVWLTNAIGSLVQKAKAQNLKSERKFTAQELIEARVEAKEEERERILLELRRLMRTSDDALDTTYIINNGVKTSLPKGNNVADSHYNLALIHIEEKIKNLSNTNK